jgi:hypothetical protein
LDPKQQLDCLIVGGAKMGKTTLLHQLIHSLHGPREKAKPTIQWQPQEGQPQGNQQLLVVVALPKSPREFWLESGQLPNVPGEFLEEVITARTIPTARDFWRILRWQLLGDIQKLRNLFADQSRKLAWLLDITWKASPANVYEIGERFANTQVTIALLIDDLDRYIEDRGFALEFFAQLFSLSARANGAVRLVATSTVADLRYTFEGRFRGNEKDNDYQIALSFLDSFYKTEPVHLSPLIKLDVVKLAGLAKEFSLEDAERVYEESGGHPLLAQALCRQAWEEAQSKQPLIATDWDSIVEKTRNTEEVKGIVACARQAIHPSRRKTMQIEVISVLERLANRGRLEGPGWFEPIVMSEDAYQCLKEAFVLRDLSSVEQRDLDRLDVIPWKTSQDSYAETRHTAIAARMMLSGLRSPERLQGSGIDVLSWIFGIGTAASLLVPRLLEFLGNRGIYHGPSLSGFALPLGILWWLIWLYAVIQDFREEKTLRSLMSWRFAFHLTALLISCAVPAALKVGLLLLFAAVCSFFGVAFVIRVRHDSTDQEAFAVTLLGAAVALFIAMIGLFVGSWWWFFLGGIVAMWISLASVMPS